MADPGQPQDFVGDSRVVRIFSIHPSAPESCVEVGDVWQGEDGTLYGSGMAAMLLFEPSTITRYKSASLMMDVSPLSVFYQRIFRSSFLLPEFMEGKGHA